MCVDKKGTTISFFLKKNSDNYLCFTLILFFLAMFHFRSVSQPAFFSLDAISLQSSASTSPSDSPTSINGRGDLPYALALPPSKSHHMSQSKTQFEYDGLFNFSPKIDKKEINGEFTPTEMKKMMEIKNKKLVEMALADPKRVKRILANRQSAARSKEKKIRYVKELEHKVQLMQAGICTLSAQFSLMQRESRKIVNQNNELKIRLQSLEQQSQLRNVLNEVLKSEVQRLKFDVGELTT